MLSDFFHIRYNVILQAFSTTPFRTLLSRLLDSLSQLSLFTYYSIQAIARQTIVLMLVVQLPLELLKNRNRKSILEKSYQSVFISRSLQKRHFYQNLCFARFPTASLYISYIIIFLKPCLYQLFSTIKIQQYK